jgi:DNA recombination protein RmuC
VFQTILKSDQSIDMQKLSANLQAVQNGIVALQDEIDSRFSKALTMLNNSRDDMRAHLSKASSSVTGLQIVTSNESPKPILSESSSVTVM